MKPMKRRKRLVYLALSYALFFILLPFVVMYASGYRIDREWAIYRTGGFYISAFKNNSRISVNGEYVDSLSTFDKGFFVQNLKPQVYDVEISKKGYFPWKKKIFVEEGIVTENSALLIPEEINFTTIASTTDNFLEIVDIFGEPGLNNRTISKTEEGDINEYILSYSGVVIETGDNGSLKAKWGKEGSKNYPFFFCLYGKCQEEFEFFANLANVEDVDFYPGRSDTILATLPGGIYLVGLDLTPPQLVHPIYPVRGAQFRIIDGEVYVKDGDIIGRIEI